MSKDLKQHFDKIKDSVQSGFKNSMQYVVQQQQQLSSCRPSTLALEHHKLIKKGWLRKLSRVLNFLKWERKWFVLKGDCMYYYSNDSDIISQGIVLLSGAEIIEKNYKIYDSDKFVFEITPKVTTEGYSRLPGHDVLTLAAQTEEERTDWVRVIKQILYGSRGGAIFGKPLEEILKFETPRKIPEIIESCVEYILKNGIYEVGIFRITGGSSIVKRYCDAYDRGERPSMEDDEDMDVHSASSILKLYLRELPSPLVPFEFYEDVMRIVMRELPINECNAMQSLKQILGEISSPFYDLLKYLSEFLNTIGQQHLINKMTFANLATVFCTAFLRPELEKDACLLMATANSRKAVTHVLIEHQHWLFGIGTEPFNGAIDLEGIMGFSKSSFKRVDEVNRSIKQDFIKRDLHFTRLPKNENFEDLEDERLKSVTMRKSTDIKDQKAKQSNRKCLEAHKDVEDGDTNWRWPSSNIYSSFDEEEEKFYSPIEFHDGDLRHLKSFENKKKNRDEFTDDNIIVEFTKMEIADKSVEGNNLETSGEQILPRSSFTENNIEQLTKCPDSVDKLSNDELRHVITILLSHIHDQNAIIVDLNEKLKFAEFE